jgi:hypothetical protein
MNARQLLDFLKKPEGRFFVAVFLILLLLAVVWLFYGSKASQAKVETISTTFQKGKQGIEDLTSNVPRFTPAPAKPSYQITQSRTNQAPQPPPPIPIGIGKTVVPSVNLSSDSAPYGRLIKCKLVITVDSSSMDTPIIGLVTEDVYNSYGDLIIPAGSEVHGTAQTDRVRERIGSNDRWVIVMATPDEEELTLSGRALDEDVAPDGQSWGLTDGSAGLRGTIIKSDKFAELKIFAATFLAAGVQGLESTGVDNFSGIETYQNTPRNAVLQGTAAVVNNYAQSILDAVKRDGFFVRVPAGKQFYLYVTQPIDRSDARRGDSLYHPDPNSTHSHT